jgi:hypothetical protein
VAAREGYAAQVGGAFRVQGTPVELTLVGVQPARTNPEYEAFSLLLRGPAEPSLPQATYVLENAVLGAEPIFIVPVAAEVGGIQYEAVFNRRR